MMDKDIKEKLEWFKIKIFTMPASEADTIKQQFDEFVRVNNLTAEDLMDFAQSGAGEMLEMMVS